MTPSQRIEEGARLCEFARALGRELLDCAALVFDYWHGFKTGALTREEPPSPATPRAEPPVPRPREPSSAVLL